MFPYVTSTGFQYSPTYAKNAEYATQQIKFSEPQSNLSPHLPKMFASVIIFFFLKHTHIPGNYFFLFCRLILTSTNIYNGILRNALWLGSITVRHIMYLHKPQSGSLCMASWFRKMKYMRLYKHNISLILSGFFNNRSKSKAAVRLGLLLNIRTLA